MPASLNSGQVIDIASMRYLLAIAEAGSFAQAAAALNLNSSTLTRRITALEDRLGLTLLERSRAGVRLTSAGRQVMSRVRRVLGELEGVQDFAQNMSVGVKGTLRLGVRLPPVGEPLVRLLSDWHEQCPDVRLTIHEMNDHELRLALTELRIDAALVVNHARWLGSWGMALLRERIYAALPSDHPLTTGSAIKWSMLRSEVILTQEWDESRVAREFFASLLGSGVSFQGHPASKQSILSLVAARFGVTLVVESQATVKMPGIAFLPIAEENAWAAVDLVWRPESEEPVLGRFTAFMRDQVQPRGLLF